MNKILLDKLTVAIPIIIEKERLNLISVEISVNDLANALVAVLKTGIYSRKLEPVTISKTANTFVTYPATWWDALKLELENKWWFPFRSIRYTSQRVTLEVSQSFLVTVTLPEIVGIGKQIPYIIECSDLPKHKFTIEEIPNE